MIRTQIYLPKQLYQEVDLEAKIERKPKAQIIREVLEDGLSRRRAKTTVGEGLAKLIAVGHKYASKKVPTDLSINHDKYLYEED